MIDRVDDQRVWDYGTGRVQKIDDVPLMEEDQVREYICKLDVPKSRGPEGGDQWHILQSEVSN